MKPYLDAGFLLTLLVKTGGSEVAASILQTFNAPYELNLLQQLQAEAFLKAGPRSHPRLASTFMQAEKTWFRHLEESIFVLADSDWGSALKLAIGWTEAVQIVTPHPLLILHPALAVVEGYTHFLSFDPRAREFARRTTMTLLPHRL
jgi:hypothetical protein